MSNPSTYKSEAINQKRNSQRMIVFCFIMIALMVLLCAFNLATGGFILVVINLLSIALFLEAISRARKTIAICEETITEAGSVLLDKE